jgi:uncharacterized protein YjiS (DUF1127 family)
MSCLPFDNGKPRGRMMTALPSVPAARRRGAAGTEPGRLLGRLMGWVMRRRRAFALARLPDLVLLDIGLTRIDTEMEADKPFWWP